MGQMAPEHQAGRGEGPAIVQVMDSMGLDRGGLTRAVFDRLRLLGEGRRCILVTTAYQPDAERLFAKLKELGQVPQHAELLAFHVDQRSRPSTCEALGPIEGFLTDTQPVKEGSTMIRLYRRGAFVGLQAHNAEGELVHSEVHDEMRPWVRLLKEGRWGEHPGLREYFDDNNRVRFKVYQGPDARPYMSSWVAAAGNEYRVVDFTRVPHTVADTVRAVNAVWLAERLKEIGPAVVFCDEPRATFALQVQSPDVAHISTVHAPHVANERDHSDGVKHWMNHFTEGTANVAKLVTYTSVQRKDLMQDLEWGPEKVACLHHPAPPVNMAEGRRVGLVMVARLAKGKRVQLAIRAFAQVADEFPDEVLRIYGKGPQQQSLEKLIDELGMRGRVQLLGHTSDPLAAFGAAKASVLTSDSEGFGLVIIESMSQGTPVVAFDVMYGPRDAIASGANGILVRDGDVALLADAFRTILEGETLHILREGARATAAEYTPSLWATKWRGIFDDAQRSLRGSTA